jgi:glucose uptake protein GlcU
VPAGPRTFLGFTIGQFSLIVLGVVAFIAIVIGICMYMIAKNRQKQFAFMKNINIKKPNKK